MDIQEYTAELASRVEGEFKKRGYVYDSVCPGTGNDEGCVMVAYPVSDSASETERFPCHDHFQSQKMWLEGADQAAVNDLYDRTAASFADFYMKWYAHMLQARHKKDVMSQKITDPDYVYENVYAELVDLACCDPGIHVAMYDNALNLAYAFKVADPACTLWRNLLKTDPVLQLVDHQRLLAEALEHTDRHVRAHMLCRHMFDVLADEICGPGADPAERQACIDGLKAEMNGASVSQYVAKLDCSGLLPSAMLLSRYAMSKIAADIGARSSLLVIPSSVYELIIHDMDAPELMLDKQMLRDAVPETNAQLAPGDVLGTMPYEYDVKTATLRAF